MVGAGSMNLHRSGWQQRRLPVAALQRLTLGTGLPGHLAWVFLLIQAGVQRVPMEPEAGRQPEAQLWGLVSKGVVFYSAWLGNRWGIQHRGVTWCGLCSNISTSVLALLLYGE